MYGELRNTKGRIQKQKIIVFLWWWNHPRISYFAHPQNEESAFDFGSVLPNVIVLHILLWL